jgi:hypothetical protein
MPAAWVDQLGRNTVHLTELNVLYRVVYEVMEDDVGMIIEKIMHIDVEVSGDIKRRLTVELQKREPGAMVANYRVESEGDEVIWDYGFY